MSPNYTHRFVTSSSPNFNSKFMTSGVVPHTYFWEVMHNIAPHNFCCSNLCRQQACVKDKDIERLEASSSSVEIILCKMHFLAPFLLCSVISMHFPRSQETESSICSIVSADIRGKTCQLVSDQKSLFKEKTLLGNEWEKEMQKAELPTAVDEKS